MPLHPDHAAAAEGVTGAAAIPPPRCARLLRWLRRWSNTIAAVAIALSAAFATVGLWFSSKQIADADRTNRAAVLTKTASDTAIAIQQMNQGNISNYSIIAQLYTLYENHQLDTITDDAYLVFSNAWCEAFRNTTALVKKDWDSEKRLYHDQSFKRYVTELFEGQPPCAPQNP